MTSGKSFQFAPFPHSVQFRMRTCFLCSILVFAQAISVQSDDVEDDLWAIDDLELNDNAKNISTFTPTKNSIDMEELEELDKKLGSSKSKAKRQSGPMNPHINRDEYVRNQISSFENVKSEIESEVKTITLPNSKGNPSFSIHASTVYILYPAIFQDPNVFGRISIPQNVNMDKGSHKMSSEHDQLIRLPDTQKNRRYNPSSPLFNGYRSRRNVPYIHPKRRGNLGSVTQEKQVNSSIEDQPEKRSVQTHATGTIVVLNQDVIEQNSKKSY